MWLARIVAPSGNGYAVDCGSDVGGKFPVAVYV